MGRPDCCGWPGLARPAGLSPAPPPGSASRPAARRVGRGARGRGRWGPPGAGRPSRVGTRGHDGPGDGSGRGLPPADRGIDRHAMAFHVHALQVDLVVAVLVAVGGRRTRGGTARRSDATAGTIIETELLGTAPGARQGRPARTGRHRDTARQHREQTEHRRPAGEPPGSRPGVTRPGRDRGDPDRRATGQMTAGSLRVRVHVSSPGSGPPVASRPDTVRPAGTSPRVHRTSTSNPAPGAAPDRARAQRKRPPAARPPVPTAP